MSTIHLSSIVYSCKLSCETNNNIYHTSKTPYDLISKHKAYKRKRMSKVKSVYLLSLRAVWSPRISNMSLSDVLDVTILSPVGSAQRGLVVLH